MEWRESTRKPWELTNNERNGINGADDEYLESQLGGRYSAPGETRLMHAVLRDAVEVITARVEASVLELRQARHWIESRERWVPFSYEVVCETLGLDTDGLRRKLLRVADRTLATQVNGNRTFSEHGEKMRQIAAELPADFRKARSIKAGAIAALARTATARAQYAARGFHLPEGKCGLCGESTKKLFCTSLCGQNFRRLRFGRPDREPNLSAVA